jgi:hypothetical protein
MRHDRQAVLMCARGTQGTDLLSVPQMGDCVKEINV